MRYNETSGVLPMDDKLTLRNIKKSAAGEYSCSATNTEGETYSPPHRLEVQCKYMYTLTCKSVWMIFFFCEILLLCWEEQEILVLSNVFVNYEFGSWRFWAINISVSFFFVKNCWFANPVLKFKKFGTIRFRAKILPYISTDLSNTFINQKLSNFNFLSQKSVRNFMELLSPIFESQLKQCSLAYCYSKFWKTEYYSILTK